LKVPKACSLAKTVDHSILKAQTIVSVIIPTFREWHLLTNCLTALERQSYNKEHFEIIVVNNDPTDPPPPGFRLPTNCIIIGESKPGSYAARNAGLRVSKGEIIAFTDSDCMPDENWITNALRHFENNPACQRIGGEMKIIFKSGRPTLVEMYNQLYAFPQAWLIANGGSSVTGNLFSYKYIFDAVGGFDENMLSMGDVEWGKRATAKGYNIVYASDVVVSHPPRNFKSLVKKEKRHGGGAANFADQKGAVGSLVRLLYQLRPRLNAVRFMLSRKRHLSIRDRIMIPLLRYYLLNVREFEKFRVQMGKPPNRT
jgi:GT2 family glycosyltransferase